MHKKLDWYLLERVFINLYVDINSDDKYLKPKVNVMSDIMQIISERSMIPAPNEDLFYNRFAIVLLTTHYAKCKVPFQYNRYRQTEARLRIIITLHFC